MGHEIRYVSFPGDMSKEEIVKECDNIAIRDGEYHTSLNSRIEFFSTSPLLNKEQAEKYIKERDRAFYGAYAVRYYVYPGDVSSKRQEELIKKLQEARAKYYTVSNELHFKDVKSAFIGCKECGSKISSAHLRSNRCPVCNKDMRPETKIKQIEALKAKADALAEQLKAETEKVQAKAKAKAKVYWLVKFEYHI